MLANSRLSRRLLSLNRWAAQLVGLMVAWCWDRCRTFLEYGSRRLEGGITVRCCAVEHARRRPERRGGSFGSSDAARCGKGLFIFFMVDPSSPCSSQLSSRRLLFPLAPSRWSLDHDGARGISRGSSMSAAVCKCQVLAIGRCVDCGDAFCASHQAVLGYQRFSDLCDACYQKRQVADRIRATASSRSSEELPDLIVAAAKRLTRAGIPPVARQDMVWVRRHFGRDRKEARPLAPAWGVGEFKWSQLEGSNQGSSAVRPTGVTPAGHIVPMMCATVAEHRTNLPQEERAGLVSNLPTALVSADPFAYGGGMDLGKILTALSALVPSSPG
jgi:hypothetical protein